MSFKSRKLMSNNDYMYSTCKDAESVLHTNCSVIVINMYVSIEQFLSWIHVHVHVHCSYEDDCLAVYYICICFVLTKCFAVVTS